MSDPSPPLRPYARGPVPAWTASEATAFDGRAIDDIGVPQAVLMENAGRSAALVALEVLFDRRTVGSSKVGPVVALVGSGNNGGDALVALRSFAAWGLETRALLVADRLGADPLLHGWPLDISLDEDLDDAGLRALLGSASLIVDGILGTGVRGAPRPRQARIIDAVNESAASVLALDVPSGADATTGGVPGRIVDAELTVSFGAPKTGALVHPARAHVGRHVTVEIGFPPLTGDDAAAFAVTPRWVAERLPRRGTDTHKNQVGRVVVVGGGPGMAGAAILAARGAFRAGAGLVHVVTAAENRDAVHSALPEAIVVAWAETARLAETLDEAGAVVVGPGLGRTAESADILRRTLRTGEAPVVLDADGLNLLAEGAVAIPEGRRILMTPHPGEMRRLLEEPSAVDPPNESGVRDTSPLTLAREAARRYDCAVLFKGAPSVVAAGGGPAAIDTQSSSDLAVAGMGDTLAGVCGALSAQGLDLADAGAIGLYLSGRAATLVGRGAGLTPSDVAESVPDAIGEITGLADGVVSGSTDLDLPFILFDADPAR